MNAWIKVRDSWRDTIYESTAKEPWTRRARVYFSSGAWSVVYQSRGAGFSRHDSRDYAHRKARHFVRTGEM